jgi:RNA polymerase sigma-70 factor, ECF subfamily
LIQEVLSELDDGEKEVLTRFYLWKQRPEQICSIMRLSETQFRLIKSCAKARFIALAE